MKKIFPVIFNLILFIFAGLLIFKTFAPMYHSLIVRGDSLVLHWYWEPKTIEFFLKSDHALYTFSMFWTTFARYIPELLKIHPQTWFSTVNFYVLFAVMCFLQISFLCNFIKYFKNKSLSAFWIFFIFFIFAGLMHKSDTLWLLADDCWSFAYLFSPIFSLVLLMEFEKIYVKDEYSKISTAHKCVLLLLIICLGGTFECSRFVICSSILITYLLHLFFVNGKINHKKYWLFYCFTVFFSLLPFFSPRFQWWLDSRILSINDLIDFIPSYLSSYFSNVFVSNFPIIALIFLLILVAVLFTPKNEERKKIIIFSVSVVISIFLFSLLIIVGQEFTEYSFEHPGVKLMTKIYLFNVILSLVGWLITKLKINSIEVYTVAISFVILYLYVKPINFTDEFMINLNKEIQKRIYILERVFDLYGKENKVYLNCLDIDSVVPTYSLMYFIFLYDRGGDFEKYEQINFCDANESHDVCNQKLIDFLKDKTGYVLTKEEIEKLDFQKYYRY